MGDLGGPHHLAVFVVEDGHACGFRARIDFEPKRVLLRQPVNFLQSNDEWEPPIDDCFPCAEKPASLSRMDRLTGLLLLIDDQDIRHAKVSFKALAGLQMSWLTWVTCSSLRFTSGDLLAALSFTPHVSV
jgi:hypothetical protein